MVLALSEYTILERIHLKNDKLLFRAEARADEKKVLLKIMENSQPKGNSPSFSEELEISQRLSHKGIARYLKLETFYNGVIAVIEHVEGLPLETFIYNCRLGVEHFLRLAISITEIIEELHKNGLVHQGLCPAGFLIDPKTLDIHLIDFSGASYAGNGGGRAAVLSAPLAYISPEQTGRLKSEIDIRSDLYSLGIMLYEIITGKLPFEADDALSLIHCHIAKNAIPPQQLSPGIPGPLSLVIMKLLAKNPGDRYQSPVGLKNDLKLCLADWVDHGHIALSQLGQHDFSGRLQQPRQFFGREAELIALEKSYERASTGAVEIMLVEGPSGIGKSSLVHQLKEQVFPRGGVFVEGKFDQFQSNIPYSGFIQALKAFTDCILTQDPEKVAHRKTAILKAVGSNGRVLTDIIPRLELLTGPQSALPELELAETQNRFHYVFGNFIKCISTRENPLVIFFDDIQWSDAASLHLIKTISVDQHLQHFLFICAYRENEITANSAFDASIKELYSNGCHIQRVLLSQLSDENTEKIIAEILGVGVEFENVMMKSVVHRSHGNPFFIKAYLESLFSEQVIAFDFYDNKWKWDSGKMSGLKFSGNIVDLMSGRIKKLPEHTRESLKLAACLGYQFDVNLLAGIRGETLAQINEHLQPAIAEGLVIADKENYRFSHDRIQQAAYSLISEADKTGTHLSIGRTLMKNLDSETAQLYIFEIVNQLNAGSHAIVSNADKIELAGLNLAAGIKAKSSAAYKTSFDYLQKGIQSLHTDSWRQHYELTLQLHTEGAESGLLSGYHQPMEEWIALVFKNAVNILDKVKAYEIKIKFYISRQQILDALKTALQILELLDVRFPAKPTKIHVLLALVKIRIAFGRKSIETLADLPPIENKYAEAAIRILANVGSAAYFARPELFPLFVLKAFSLMQQYGNSPYSGVVCGSFGIIMVGGLEKINMGYRLGNMAFRLADNFEASSYKYQCNFIVNNFIIHWKEHLELILEPIRKNYRNCLETGNPEFASYCGQLYCMWSFFCGKNLQELRGEMMEFLDSLKQLGQEISLNLHKIHTQAALNLQSPDGDPTVLTGEVHNELDMLAVYKATRAEPLILSVYLYKTILLYYFGDFSQAALYSKEAEGKLESIAGSAEVIIFYYFDALIQCALVPELSGGKRKNALRHIRRNTKKLAKYNRYGPMNCSHRLLLVEAETCRITGRFEQAGLLYDRAIAAAQQNRYTSDLVLIFELTGRFYLAQQKEFIARHYLAGAFNYCRTWGAWAKLNQMKKNYEYLFENEPGKATAIEWDMMQGKAMSSLSDGRFKEPDLHSILKAATAISGEVELPGLLKTLIKIAVENTGAQQGYLVLRKDEDFFIEARSSVDAEEEAIVQSVPLGKTGSIQEQIIKFVCLTAENVVIGDTTEHSRFMPDAGHSKKRCKSILCVPIVHQGGVIGLLYFENDLINNAFTPDRIEFLKLLSGQMAVSLQNALNEQKKMNSLLEKEKLLAQINLHEQELLKTKLEIQEQTFNNISAEIHDNIGQTLSFIKLIINTIDVGDEATTLQKLAESKVLLSRVIQDLRDLAKTFNTDFIINTGLVNGLRQQLQFLGKTGLYATSLSVAGEEEKYESHCELVLFRIVQELLNNVVRHADATVITIVMDYTPEKLIISVRDNGKGFDEQLQGPEGKKGLGLTNIRNRIALIGGQVSFDSNTGSGTNAVIELLK